MLPTRTIINHLSAVQRNCLIDHIDTPQPFLRIGDAVTNGLHRTKNILMEKGLLCATENAIRPKDRVKELRLTELGRAVVCEILGEYADFLVRAGALEDLTKSQLLDRIRWALQRRPECNITISPAAATPTDTHAQNTLRDRAASLRLLHLLQGGSSPTRSP